jgi:hypothetical protein
LELVTWEWAGFDAVQAVMMKKIADEGETITTSSKV